MVRQTKAAWGVLEKNESQLKISSYELGVLFLPSFHVSTGRSCLKLFTAFASSSLHLINTVEDLRIENSEPVPSLRAINYDL